MIRPGGMRDRSTAAGCPSSSVTATAMWRNMRRWSYERGRGRSRRLCDCLLHRDRWGRGRLCSWVGYVCSLATSAAAIVFPSLAVSLIPLGRDGQSHLHPSPPKSPLTRSARSRARPPAAGRRGGRHGAPLPAPRQDQGVGLYEASPRGRRQELLGGFRKVFV